MFDNLLTLSAPKKDLLDDELMQYLAASTEHADNPFYGGMKGVLYILIFLRWHAITLVFQVFIFY